MCFESYLYGSLVLVWGFEILHVFDAVRSISDKFKIAIGQDELQGFITYRATVKTGGPLFNGTRRGL